MLSRSRVFNCRANVYPCPVLALAVELARLGYARATIVRDIITSKFVTRIVGVGIWAALGPRACPRGALDVRNVKRILAAGIYIYIYIYILDRR